jgi:hypothetical protein
MAAEDVEGLLDSADNFSIRPNKRRMKILRISIRRGLSGDSGDSRRGGLS